MRMYKALATLLLTMCGFINLHAQFINNLPADAPSIFITTASDPIVINMAVSNVWDYGNDALNQPLTHPLFIWNLSTSNSNLIITPGTTLTSPFSFIPSGTYTITPGHFKAFTVTFKPTSGGTFNQTWHIANNSTNLSPTYNLILKGKGVAGAAINMSVNPAVLTFDFGNVPVNQYLFQYYTISNLNTSEAALILSWPHLSLPYSVGAFAGSILVNMNYQLSVGFFPTTLGTFNKTLTITNNSTNLPHSYVIHFTGTGTP